VNVNVNTNNIDSLLKKQTTVNFDATNTATIDDNLVRDLAMRVNQLAGDLDQLKKEFSKWIKELQDMLNQKVDIEALQNLDKLLMERINEIVKALTKQLADKNDTKKALKLLER